MSQGIEWNDRDVTISGLMAILADLFAFICDLPKDTEYRVNIRIEAESPKEDLSEDG